MTGSEKTPGILSLIGQNNGFDNNQDWYILSLDDDVLMAYYCGYLMTWKFEGLLIMSKTPSIDVNKLPNIERILSGMDLKLSDLCALNPSQDCPVQKVTKFLQN